MKNIKTIRIEELDNPSIYGVEDGAIVKNLETNSLGLPISFELENGEDDQYPLEDVLDRFLVHIEEELESQNESERRCIFGGDFDDLRKAHSIVGKRVYNETYVSADGEERIRLVIRD